MKTLMLLRHAKSSWDEPGLADFDRPLNRRGEKDAPRMGERLAASGLPLDVLVSSPARRAAATARAVATVIGFDTEQILWEKGIYEATVGELLALVRALDESWRQVLLVGHNPGLTELVNLLSNARLDNLPTCGLAILRLPAKTWDEVPTPGAAWVIDYPKNPQPASYL